MSDHHGTIRRLLITPGPTNVSHEVRSALLAPDMSHRDPAFRAVLARVTERLSRLLGGEETHSCVLFAGSGTGAMEAIISSLHGELMVLANGRYSERVALMAERFGVPTKRHSLPEREPPDLVGLERALEAIPSLTHLALVHHETTTGALLPLTALGEIAERHGLRLIVDGVSSVGGHDLHLVEDRVDYLSLNPNKCLESLPGVGLVLARNELLDELKGKARSFYFDLHAQWRRLQRREVPYTIPVQVTCALDVAVRRLGEEGYGPRVKRYARIAAYARRALSEAGFDLIELPESIRGNVITTMRLPMGVEFERLHDRLLEDGVTLYSDSATIASGRFFVATMGSITEADVDFAVERLKAATWKRPAESVA